MNRPDHRSLLYFVSLLGVSPFGRTVTHVIPDADDIFPKHRGKKGTTLRSADMKNAAYRRANRLYRLNYLVLEVHFMSNLTLRAISYSMHNIICASS